MGTGKPIRLTVGSAAAIGEGRDAAVLVRVEDFVAGPAGNAELGAQRRHLFALEQAGDKPEPLVHDVTLLPRHRPYFKGQSVTHVSGIRRTLSTNTDGQQTCEHRA
jgi:hypothetical protein